MLQIATGPYVSRILLAAGLSAVIGLEREYHQKPAGLRTNMLIGIGSAVFAILSLAFAQGGAGSADRLVAQVVTGIGFLGAGAILRSGQSVHGLTTAATIWVNAAIGIAAGVGAAGVAVATTVVTLVVLAVLPPIEGFFQRWAHRRGVHSPLIRKADTTDRLKG